MKDEIAREQAELAGKAEWMRLEYGRAVATVLDDLRHHPSHANCVRWLISEIERLTEGGCGKPGHATYSSDEGTCLCLTCKLDAEVERLNRELAEYGCDKADDFGNLCADQKLPLCPTCQARAALAGREERK